MAFAALKDDIASAGSNVQPVSVRAVPPGVLNGSTPEAAPHVRRSCLRTPAAPCLPGAGPAGAGHRSPTLTDQAAVRGHGAREPRPQEPQRLGAGHHVPPCAGRGVVSLAAQAWPRRWGSTSRWCPRACRIRAPARRSGGGFSPVPWTSSSAGPSPWPKRLQKDPDGMLARAVRLRATGAASQGGERGAGGAHGRATAQDVLNGSTPSRQVIEGPKGRSTVLSRDARGRLLLEFSARCR
jgi:hypothetical protein